MDSDFAWSRILLFPVDSWGKICKILTVMKIVSIDCYTNCNVIWW